jgi:23S rRNA pseudouridine2605 synthase
MKERLHKVLAHCGVGSRRECETIIEQGRVRVNGAVVTKLGTKVDPEVDKLDVDGEDVRLEEKVYYLLHKPRGYICTNQDERGRPRAIDLVRDDRRIYTVGRLDAQSEGLILLTNDGSLANVLCHPRYQVPKTYRLLVKGPVFDEQLDRIEHGVWLAEGKTGPARVRRIERMGPRSVVTVTVWEGRNRELRRVFAKVDLRVTHLTRVAIGPLTIENLAPGEYRKLDPAELAFAFERLVEGWKPVEVPPLPEPPPRDSGRGGRRSDRGFGRRQGRGAGAGEPRRLERGPWRERESFGNFRPRRQGPGGQGGPRRGPGGRYGPGRGGEPGGRYGAGPGGRYGAGPGGRGDPGGRYGAGPGGPDRRRDFRGGPRRGGPPPAPRG